MFRYLIWLLYTITTGCLAVGVTSLLCIREGIDAYWGIFFVAIYAMLAAGGIVLLCRVMSDIRFFIDKNRSLFVVLEATLAVTFVVVGILFRIEGIEGASGGENYYILAKVTTGQEIPKIVHGAVYLYLQMLHGAFVLFGNYFAVGIWIQILLQMIASVLLFLVVRRMAGVIAALVSLGFCMCAPYMVRNALMLSPEMLYFCFLAIAVAIMAGGYTGKWKPWLFLPTGFFIAIYGYLDVIGILLLIPAFGMICCCQELKVSRKMAAVVLCLMGVCVGFFSCIVLDAFLSGASILKVAQAWFLLYCPKSFRVPVVVEGMVSDMEGIVLLGFMIFGIFSFWRDPEKERMTACVVAVGIIILAGCYGIFTDEMPGSYILYVLFSVLAGVGVGQCYHAASLERTMEVGSDGETQTIGTTLDAQIQTREAVGDVEIQTMRAEYGADNFDDMSEVTDFWSEDISFDDKAWEEAVNEAEIAEDSSNKRVVKYIENPLPLPKKHVKRSLEFARTVTLAEEDFDHVVETDDDFDI